MTATRTNTDYHFDAHAAERPIRFIEQHIVHITTGEPLVLEEFQKDIIRQAFGWKITKTGRRKHRFVYVELPKGNAKSYLLSALTIYMACAEGQKVAECYCAAGDKEQARIVFDTCKAMITESPTLRDKFDIFKNAIIHKKSNSKIIVISAEAYSKHGYRPWCIAFDELHVQPNRELYDTITKGLIKIPDSICFMITTAGVKNTFAEEIHDYALKIKKGLVKNPYWLPIIFAADPKDDPFKQKTWEKANPGLGKIIGLEDFKIIAEEAKSQPTALNSFLRLHLNIWTGSVEAWIPSHEWEKCNLRDIPPCKDFFTSGKYQELSKYPCFGGLDLGLSGDLSCLALLFEIQEDVSYELVLFSWCPEDGIYERTLKENSNYEFWIKEGYIIPTTGNIQDQTAIKDTLIWCKQNLDLRSIGYDSYYAKVLAAEMYGDFDINMRPIPQQLKPLAQPTKTFQDWIYGKILNHGGNPVLAWMANNTMIHRDTNDNIRPHKGKSKGRIDGIMASLDSIAAMLDWKADPDNQPFDANNAISWIN